MSLEALKIGFMQGRLSPQLLSRMQTFPAGYWREELYLAAKLGFSQVEWTVDSPTISINPILDSESQIQIRSECARHKIELNSVTCDFFMENPLWDSDFQSLTLLRNTFQRLFRATDNLGPLCLVVPLVDNSRLRNLSDFDLVVNFLFECNLEKYPIVIAFESSVQPKFLSESIRSLPKNLFGITLDIGNSASLGFDSSEEFSLFGDRIVNVHLKDRLLNGPSVPFGTGHTNFREYFKLLRQSGYVGNLILQSYRSKSNYVSEIIHSRNYTLAMNEGLKSI